MNRNFSGLSLDFDLLDQLLAHVAIFDQEGTILHTNKSWNAFNDKTMQIKRSATGSNYFEILQQAVELGNDNALKCLLGIKKVIRGEKGSYSLTYPVQTKSESYWFKLTVRSCNDESTQFVMIHEDITASIKAKNEHREGQNRYQIQFEQSLEGILITDIEGNIIDANPAAGDIIGRDREDLISHKCGDLIDTGDPNYQEVLEHSKENGVYRFEGNLIHRDGSRIPAELSSRAYRDQKGKIKVIITFWDISRRRKTESELEKTKRFAEAALESIPGAFFVLNNKGEIVRWNKNMVTRLGYTAEELAGKDVLDFVVEDYEQAAIDQFESCLKGQELSFETKVYNKKGEIRDYFIGAKRFIEDGKVYIAGAALDMTREKDIERENRKNQIMLEQLFDNAPVGLAIVNTENKIKKVNSSFGDIFEYEKDEVIGKNINKLLAPDAKKDEAEAISLNTQNGQSLQTETKRLTKSNKEIPVLIGSVPVELNEEIIAIYGIYVDVSKQNEYRQRIEKALDEKETLLAELHHRVKNNLALINSLLELQVFESDSPELRKEFENIKNRILTIASVHEVLYQNGSLSRIPFGNFLQEMFKAGSIHDKMASQNIRLLTDGQEVFLTINQSIPCGLLLNELLALIFEFMDADESGSHDLTIRIHEAGNKMHLVVEGENILKCPAQVREHRSLHNILIDTLVTQLNGELTWPEPEGKHQKFELCFAKSNGNGPARDLLETSD